MIEGQHRRGNCFQCGRIFRVELVQDQRTLGWTVNVENCCTSYSIPLSVVLFRDRRVPHTLDQGQMIWNWMFVQGGKEVAVVFGPTHGSEVGDHRLYDVVQCALKVLPVMLASWTDDHRHDRAALSIRLAHTAHPLQVCVVVYSEAIRSAP